MLSHSLKFVDSKALPTSCPFWGGGVQVCSRMVSFLSCAFFYQPTSVCLFKGLVVQSGRSMGMFTIPRSPAVFFRVATPPSLSRATLGGGGEGRLIDVSHCPSPPSLAAGIGRAAVHRRVLRAGGRAPDPDPTAPLPGPGAAASHHHLITCQSCRCLGSPLSPLRDGGISLY